jgi:hypothetical protein
MRSAKMWCLNPCLENEEIAMNWKKRPPQVCRRIIGCCHKDGSEQNIMALNKKSLEWHNIVQKKELSSQ